MSYIKQVCFDTYFECCYSVTHLMATGIEFHRFTAAAKKDLSP